MVDQVKKWTTQGVVDVEIWKSLDVRGIVDFNPTVVQLSSGPASLTREREYFYLYINCIYLSFKIKGKKKTVNSPHPTNTTVTGYHFH